MSPSTSTTSCGAELIGARASTLDVSVPALAPVLLIVALDSAVALALLAALVAVLLAETLRAFFFGATLVSLSVSASAELAFFAALVAFFAAAFFGAALVGASSVAGVSLPAFAFGAAFLRG